MSLFYVFQIPAAFPGETNNASRVHALELRANGGELVSSDGGGHFDSRSLTFYEGGGEVVRRVVCRAIPGNAGL